MKPGRYLANCLGEEKEEPEGKTPCPTVWPYLVTRVEKCGVVFEEVWERDRYGKPIRMLSSATGPLTA